MYYLYTTMWPEEVHALPIEHAVCIHPSSAGMLPPPPDLKTLYAVKYKDLPGTNKFNQHCVNSFDKGLNVMDIHFHSFNNDEITYQSMNRFFKL